jgi:hypothetical protein
MGSADESDSVAGTGVPKMRSSCGFSERKSLSALRTVRGLAGGDWGSVVTVACVWDRVTQIASRGVGTAMAVARDKTIVEEDGSDHPGCANDEMSVVVPVAVKLDRGYKLSGTLVCTKDMAVGESPVIVFASQWEVSLWNWTFLFCRRCRNMGQMYLNRSCARCISSSLDCRAF